MNKAVLILWLSILLLSDSISQQTVGLFSNDSLSFNGYTLYAPSVRNTTYLVDNCGQLINSWESNYRPGQVVYLTENGDLLRTCRLNSSFNGGGTGGRIELRSWEDNLLWSYNYSTEEYHHHHDVELLPNGNILILAWEKKSVAEAIQAGRDPSRVPANGLWSERIVEIKPVGTDDIEVVWEWHLWDHLVQDFDSLANNYDTISQRPERIDLNYTELGSGVDWIHANSVDYNPEFDQIMINSRNFEEFWIIDHSTTTQEAASNAGGKYRAGGDILYRWGNPRAYDRGGPDDQKFYVQHDAHWIPAGLPDAGKIMIYNNGNDRPGGAKSSIDLVDIPVQDDGQYERPDSSSFGPDTLYWSYDGGDTNHFFSSRISGAQRQPNGNTLICVGMRGRIFEIDTAGALVWEYVNPVGISGPVSQGETPSSPDVFRAYRYSGDYHGLANKDLEPMGPLELDPLPSDCQIFDDSTTTSTYTLDPEGHYTLAPNPTSDFVFIQGENISEHTYRIFSTSGLPLDNGHFDVGGSISLGSLPSGMYIIQIFDRTNALLSIQKVIKR